MKPWIQSAIALLLVGCILAIVYSPFVDLPLTVDGKTHGPTLDQLPTLLFSAIVLAETLLMSAVSGLWSALAVPVRDASRLTGVLLC